MTEQNPYESPCAHEPTKSERSKEEVSPLSLILIAVVIGIAMTAGPSMPFDPHHEFWAERAAIGLFFGFVVGVGWMFVRRRGKFTN